MVIENRDNLGLTDNQSAFAIRHQAEFKASLGNGVLAKTVANTSLKVIQREAGVNMSVDVQLGECLADGVKYTEGSDVNLAIGNGDATHPRYDLIVYDQSAGNPVVVAGTPAASPVVPDVVADLDSPLGIVYVLANESTEVVDADITDVRAFVRVEVMATDDLILLRQDPIRLVDNATSDWGKSTCFETASTSYVDAAIFKAVAPPSAPNGYTVVIKFGCVLGTAQGVNTGDTVFCQLWEVAGTTEIVVLTKEPENTLPEDYPERIESGEISLATGLAYDVRGKTEDATYQCEILSAWFSYYAKKI